jgi:hypothetical protein
MEPFDVDPKRLFTFSSEAFTLFCNDLIRAEASRIALPQSIIDDTVRDRDPDGGIDCLVREPDYDEIRPSAVWIPSGGSAWQYKSGKCPSVRDLSKDEFRKSEVIAAIDRGDTYCFLAAQSISPKKKNQIVEAIEDIYRERGQEPKARVYTGTHLASWAKQHLSLSARHLGVPVAGWIPFERWEQASRFRNEFFADDARRDLINEIRQLIQSNDSLEAIS